MESYKQHVFIAINGIYPTETWVMRIFHYLVNYDTTTNERIKSIFQYCYQWKHINNNFNKCHCKETQNKTKIKKISFIYRIVEKIFLTMQLKMKTMLLSS